MQSAKTESMKRLFNIAIVLLAAVSVVGCKNFNTLSNGGKKTAQGAL